MHGLLIMTERQICCYRCYVSELYLMVEFTGVNKTSFRVFLLLTVCGPSKVSFLSSDMETELNTDDV